MFTMDKTTVAIKLIINANAVQTVGGDKIFATGDPRCR